MTHGREIAVTDNPCHHRSWSQLPIDLLQVISGYVTDIIDYIQFRSVCPSWRSAAKPAHLPPQLPLLLLPYDPDSDARSYYNLSVGKLFTANFPQTRNKIICGSSFGWLALLSPDSSLSLWNPFTRAQIQLPPPTGFPSYLGPTVSRYEEHYRFNNGHRDEYNSKIGYCFIRMGYPWKLSLSSSPVDGDCTVTVLLSVYNKFAYCRLKDATWTMVDTTFRSVLVAVVFHERRFYAFDCLAACAVVDPSSGKIKFIPSPNDDYSIKWLHVVKRDGDLLMVLCYAGRRLRVWKLDGEGEELRWSEVRSIGDSALFLSGNHSSILQAKDFPGCRKDSVYFSSLYDYDIEPQPGAHCIDIFNMKLKKFEQQSSEWISTAQCLRTATWITPSLC